MNINTILVVIDPTRQDQPIISRAIRVARACGACLELFLAEYHSVVDVGYGFSPEGLHAARQAFTEKRTNWLEQLADRAKAAGLKTNTHFSWTKSLHSAVIEKSQQTGADLIMKATHHHSVLKRALFTHTDWHLIRDSAAHIWLVKEDYVWDGHVEIMAAIDPMTEDQNDQGITSRILRLAYELSCSLPAELGVFHAFEPIPLGMLAGASHSKDDYTSYRAKVKKEHQVALASALASIGESNVKICLEEGAADKAIAEIADQENIDVMVVGAVSHSRLDRILVGSTAEKVLETISCDVLVVK
jgi:universal stress protein E